MVDKFRVFESYGSARAEAISLPNPYRFLREMSPFMRGGDSGPTAKHAVHRHLPPHASWEDEDEVITIRKRHPGAEGQGKKGSTKLPSWLKRMDDEEEEEETMLRSVGLKDPLVRQTHLPDEDD